MDRDEFSITKCDIKYIKRKENKLYTCKQCMQILQDIIEMILNAMIIITEQVVKAPEYASGY